MVKLSLSSGGKKLFQKYSKQYGKEATTVYFAAVLLGVDIDMPFTLSKRDLVSEDLSWVAEWLSMWPKQSQTGLDYSVSGQLPECKKRMAKFLKDAGEFGLNPSPDDITEATLRYLESQEERAWVYTKKAHKFILDTNGSELAEWLQKKEPVKKQFYL